MNKRTDAIRSMFAVDQSSTLSADNKAPMLPRVTSGSVRSLKETFSGVERENEELRAQLESGLVAIEIDPEFIDPSPLADRFEEQDTLAFKVLMESIRERGQEIPILVRAHPAEPGRYQSAYGHRRVRAAKELGLNVKAYIRNLSDEDLVVAQGVENSAREDLSFIERAVFAARLEDAGFSRSLVQSALSIDRAEASKLISVARLIPDELIFAIGRAPKVGRGRWQMLADLLKTPESLKQACDVIALPKFRVQPTDERFAAILAAAGKTVHKPTEECPPQIIKSAEGAEIAVLAFSGNRLKLVLKRSEQEGFASFLVSQIPSLFDAYSVNRAMISEKKE